MTIRPYLHLPPPATFGSLVDVASYLRRVWDAIFRLRQGKIECVTEVTLTANSATTVLNDIRLSKQSVITFDPKTPNARAEIAAGILYVDETDRGNASWTITHANNAQTDRTFQISIIG